MTEFNQMIAYLTAPDGTVFQVLNEDGSDWNEQATIDQLNAYVASNSDSAGNGYGI